MRRTFALALTLSAIGTATPAVAAEANPTIALREVERGAWVTTDIGAVFYPKLEGVGGGSAYGALIGVETGLDLTRDLQLGVLVWGQGVGADADYKGITDDALDPKAARGDFQSLLAGGTLRYAFLRLSDDNGIDRAYFSLRGAGGAAFSWPKGIIGDGLFFAAGPAVEYFTRLRHFSVGLEVDALALLTDVSETPSLGFSVVPHLKYTF